MIMARSNYIYIIRNEERLNVIVACFTVKHEARTYIERNLSENGKWVIDRHPDGGYGSRKQWNTEEFMS